MASDALQFDVLRSRREIVAAQAELHARGWVDFGSRVQRSRAASALRRVLRRDRPLPDPIKSWDVLRALEATLSSTAADLPILDLGSVACPVLPCLHELGYGNLHGIDLDRRIAQMPHAEQIDYRIADMTATPWPDDTFAAITAISVIEHGFECDALLSEVARLLRPGGSFIFSTDYWPQKLSTDGVRMFGLDWQIFSSQEIEAMLARAREYDLRPRKDPTVLLNTPPLDGEAARPVSCKGRHYTFLYGALTLESSPARG
jgi:SAM-dependent methyltransferase